MRIARVLTRLNLGGPARQVLASDPRLVRAGHTVRVFAGTPEPGEGDLFDVLGAAGVDVVRVPGLARGWSVAGDLRARRFLRRELTAFAPDVVHTHASKAGALGRSAARELDVARVHTFHGHVLEGYFGEGLSRGLRAVERRLAADTERVIAVSHATAEDLLRLGVVDERRLVVVPPGIELEPFLALAGRSGALRGLVGAGDEVFLVGVVGRLAAVKRPEWGLDVLRLLSERHPRLQIVWIGDGDQRGLVERGIAALPAELRERAHLVGARTDMPAVLADLDAVLLTSRSEGLPVALIEAAAAGLPALATPVGGVEELVAHERTGFLGATVDELAFGLDRLLSEPGLARALGQRARVRVAQRHSAEALATRLAAVYVAAVEERACAS
ncbi:MAG TPA: glycosyltransferase [Planctomycetota bacterium]|nr:glycosyltransferase [Planctomycetota bacterium]